MPHLQQLRPTSTCLPASVIIPLPHIHLISPTNFISVTTSYPTTNPILHKSTVRFCPPYHVPSLCKSDFICFPCTSVCQAVVVGSQVYDMAWWLGHLDALRFLAPCSVLLIRFVVLLYVESLTRDTILYIRLYTPICTLKSENMRKNQTKRISHRV
ncbi:uncharacterized protein BDV14DRAFT_34542 [Aspergillus stella-maris]|uniref:uncharacterized protein n=1 Tax=Aspergillus stella-maris TaxID=1810926 RepID=UPI003CCD3A47